MGPHWIEFWWGSQASVVREERLTIMNRYQDSHNWECFMWALLMKSPCSVLHLWPSFFAILEELWKYDMWSKQLVLISLIEILILGLSVSLHEIDCTLKEEAVRSNSSIRSWGSFILISYWISFWTITLCCGRICCLSPPPPKRKDFFSFYFHNVMLVVWTDYQSIQGKRACWSWIQCKSASLVCWFISAITFSPFCGLLR